VAFAAGLAAVWALRKQLFAGNSRGWNLLKQLLLRAVWIWKQAGYGIISYGDNMRRSLPAVTLIMVAVQIVFSSFFMSVLGLKTASRHPPAT